MQGRGRKQTSQQQQQQNAAWTLCPQVGLPCWGERQRWICWGGEQYLLVNSRSDALKYFLCFGVKITYSVWIMDAASAVFSGGTKQNV